MKLLFFLYGRATVFPCTWYGQKTFFMYDVTGVYTHTQPSGFYKQGLFIMPTYEYD